MRKFTYLFLTAALLVVGVGGAKATKLYFTFDAPVYCAASWDGSTRTFSWGSGGYNPAWTFITINNVSGDVSQYTKLYFKLESFTNSAEEKLTLYFKEDKGNTQSMDYVAKVEITPDVNGEFELDLTTFDWKNNANPSETIDKTKIYDVTLYGGARSGDGDGSVKIAEAYLYKPSTGPAEDPKLFTWDNLTFDGAVEVTVDNDKRFVVDSRGWSQYWCDDAYWELPVGSRDISAYKYLVIYSTQNASHHEGFVFIEDGNGHKLRGDDYKKYSWSDAEGDHNKEYTPAPVGSMGLGTWSNQHIAVIDLEFLANQDKFGDGSDCKFINTENVTKFGVGVSDEGTYINFAYLTNTLPNVNGDYTRAIDAFDKFGTVCLPFTAVCSGAEIYEIASGNASGISLNRVWGLMEAGKPYFYKTVESEIGYWGGSSTVFKPEEKLYFFRAGEENVASPVDNNGLVGTFVDAKAPLNSYVLNGNKLYQVDAANAVNVARNKAYIDITAITASARGTEFIGFNETTGITATAAQKTVDGEFYSLSGQRISQPTKGLYVKSGKKVLVK